MAKYLGPFKLNGSVANLTFSNNGHCDYVKEKSGPTRERVLHGDRSVNTLANAEEFKRAIHAGMLLRRAIPLPWMDQVKNKYLSGNMNGLFLPVVKSDPVSDWGNRAASNGNHQLLAGFEWNPELTLREALPVAAAIRIRLQPETMLVMVPGFRLVAHDGLPPGATHFRLVSCMVSLDFDQKTWTQQKAESSLLRIGEDLAGPVNLEQAIVRVTGQSSLWLMGVVFYKVDNGREKPLEGGALKICGVESGNITAVRLVA